MKTLSILIFCVWLAPCALAQPPKMTKEEVTQLAKRILATKSKPFSDGFLPDTATYLPKDRWWSFAKTGPLQDSGLVHAPSYFFYIRDADGSHRIGMLDYDRGYIPKSSQFFKPSPGMRSQAAREKQK
jgi:hypothetical protein